MKKSKILTIGISIIIICSVLALGNLFVIRHIEVNFVDEQYELSNHEILQIVDENMKTNIFYLDKNRMAEKISTHFPKGNLSLINIERIFPNKVVYYVKEHKEVFLLQCVDGNVIPTDIDFQMTKKYSSDFELNDSLIRVTNLTITESLDVIETEFLRQVMYVLKNTLNKKINAEYIKEVIFSDSYMDIITVDKTFKVPFNLSDDDILKILA